MNEELLRVCVVDDRPDESPFLLVKKGSGVEAVVRHPNDLVFEDVRDSDLVLVDYELHEWTELSDQPFAARPANGVALAAVIRAQVDAEASPTAIALYSGKVSTIAPHMPNEMRNHALAALHNLEWILEKKDEKAMERAISLAKAVRQLPAKWPTQGDARVNALAGFLALDPAGETMSPALASAVDCHPPIRELPEASHSLAPLRWLAHRILPYPTCLLDEVQVAARLRMPLDAFRNSVTNGDELATQLDVAKYRGALEGFLGDRWWRTRLDELVLEWTDGNPSGPRLTAAISTRTSSEITFFEDVCVAVLDETYVPAQVALVDDCVRLTPDDWPAYADQAWTTRELAGQHDSLAELVALEEATS
jgi:hypothetical protein